MLIHNNITFFVHINNDDEANLLRIVLPPPGLNRDYLVQVHSFLRQIFMEIGEALCISPVLKHVPSSASDGARDPEIWWILHPHVDIPIVSSVARAATVLTKVFAFHQIDLSVSARVTVLVIVYLEIVAGDFDVPFDALVQIDI